MKRIVPISKEITFRTMIGEMIEVSLEHSLELTSDSSMEGKLFIMGRYKMTEASTIEETFKEEVPVMIELDSKYDTKGVSVSIDDFYYEIINEDILRVHVDILIDGLEEKEETELLEEEIILIPDKDEECDRNDFTNEDSTLLSINNIPEVESNVEQQEKPIVLASEEQVIPIKQEEETPINSIFTALQNTEETFSTYYVYIVRENDTIESIIDKYHVTREILSDYNQLDDIKLGTKLIIPCPVSEVSQ